MDPGLSVHVDEAINAVIEVDRTSSLLSLDVFIWSFLRSPMPYHLRRLFDDEDPHTEGSTGWSSIIRNKTLKSLEIIPAYSCFAVTRHLEDSDYFHFMITATQAFVSKHGRPRGVF